MEAVVLVFGVVLGLAWVALQIVSLQVATNAMQPDEPLPFLVAALVWLLGGISSAGAVLGLSLFAMFVPFVGILIPPVVTVLVYAYILSSFTKLELTRSALAVLLWTVIQLVIAFALWAALSAATTLIG